MSLLAHKLLLLMFILMLAVLALFRLQPISRGIYSLSTRFRRSFVLSSQILTLLPSANREAQFKFRSNTGIACTFSSDWLQEDPW